MDDDEQRVFFGRDFDNWMQAQRSQAQLEGREFPKFSLCLNLGDIPAENVKLSITNRVITVSGYLKEVVEDEDGMIRETFHGFSNEFGLPEGFDPVTVRVKDNHDQSITIEADYYIPFDHHQGEEVFRSLSRRPMSAPSAHSQRDPTIGHHDALRMPVFLTSSKKSPPSSPSSMRHPPIVPATFNVSTASSRSQMKFPTNVTLLPQNITLQMPSQFSEPPLSNNTSCATVYTENNLLAAPPPFAASEMNVLRRSAVPLPENNAATFSQLNTSAMRQALQNNLQTPANVSNDMQYRLNYPSSFNQVMRIPNRNSAVLEFPPAAQLTQMKAPQQPFADCSHAILNRNSALYTPSQKRAHQYSQPNVVENIYKSETSPSKFQHEAAVSPAPNYIGKWSSVEIPLGNSYKNLDTPCLVNRSFLKPGTRCETHPSTVSPKHDYKIPGTRRHHFVQNRGENKVENRSRSLHNVSFMKNVNSHT